MRHYSVMVREALQYWVSAPGALVFLDATTGLGGHALALLEANPEARLICCDRDPESLARARERLEGFAGRVEFHAAKFSELERTLGGRQVDGLLADLGTSLAQLTSAGRGFSIMNPGPLDMRMTPEDEVTAADIVNRWNERELMDLFITLGNERSSVSRRVVRAILAERPIRDGRQLVSLIEKAVPRRGKLHPGTLIYQALRMATNREIEELDALLEQAPRLVRPGGRVVVIAFHSGESVRVKNAFRQWKREGKAVVLTKHVVKAGAEEVRENPPSRSAVLRAAQMGAIEPGNAEGEEQDDGDDRSDF
jgi:16S rRNA (cytosine1402-N4)-methyltransferase